MNTTTAPCESFFLEPADCGQGESLEAPAVNEQCASPRPRRRARRGGTAPACALLMFSVGCGGAALRQQSERSAIEGVDSLVLLAVTQDGARCEIQGVLERGQRFALIGSRNGLAVVEGPATTECDHCVLPRSAARVDHGPEGLLIALGPVVEALPSARAKAREVPMSSEWKAELEVDVDGDERYDIERVARCDRTVASGCHSQVCDRICRGTRTVGASTVRAISCQSFLPDIEDCHPPE